MDTLGELHKAEITDELYNLVYELNNDTEIIIRTAVGDTESIEIKELVAQSLIEAGVISSNSFSKEVDAFFLQMMMSFC